MQPTIHILLAALRSFQRNLDDGDLREIATNCGAKPMPTAADIDAMCEALNFGETPLPRADESVHRRTLTLLAAAMLPGGPERRRLLDSIGGPDLDDFDGDGELRDGDLYRISSDDNELAHWRSIAENGLAGSEAAPVQVAFNEKLKNTLKGCSIYLETPGNLSPEEVQHLQEEVEQCLRASCPEYFEPDEKETTTSKLLGPFLFEAPAWANSGVAPRGPAEALQRARDLSQAYYALGAQSGIHSMIEWCGVMTEYVKMLEEAHDAGIDPCDVDQHHTDCQVDVPAYMAEYFTEKLGCQLKPFIRANTSLWRRVIEDWFEGVGLHAVCEVIEQRPAVSLHATGEEALDHAARCAMENLRDPDSEADEMSDLQGYRDQLETAGSIREGDYEVFVLRVTSFEQ